MCEYCIGNNEKTSKLLPIKTNLKDEIMFALIAKGSEKHEIVINTKIGVIGIEIDRCPYCGRLFNS